MSSTILAGVFRPNCHRTRGWLSALEAALPTAATVICIDDREALPLGLRGESAISREELVHAVSKLFSYDQDRLRLEVEKYRPLLKILLGIYLRHCQAQEYAVFTDDDLFLFEPIPEVASCVSSRRAFLIPEEDATDYLPEIESFLRDATGTSPTHSHGRHFNVGLFGIRLEAMDFICAANFARLIEMLSSLDVWWKEQAFWVQLCQFTQTNVETFSDARYFFLPYSAPHYRLRSKICHWIGTTDKSAVEKLYLAGRPGQHYFKKPSAGAVATFGYFREALLRTRVGALGVRLAKRALGKPVLNACRYKHLLRATRRPDCRAVLEIGVWRGDTSAEILRHSRNADLEYHGVDVFEGTSDELIDREASLRADCRQTVERRLRKLSSRVTLHKGFSSEVLPRLMEAGLKFDVIWIDGGHSYETVKFDTEMSLRMLAPNGIILIDDYTNDPRLSGVKCYVDRELSRVSSIKVEVRSDNCDIYRGYHYRVVEVRSTEG